MWIETTTQDGNTVTVAGQGGCRGFLFRVADTSGESRAALLSDDDAADLLASLLSAGVRLNGRSQRLLADYGVVSI